MPGPRKRPKRVGMWGIRRPAERPKKYKPHPPIRHAAMKEAIRLRIDRANDRSESARMVSKNTVNPNRMSQVARPGRYKPSLRPFRPRPLLPGLKRPKRPGRKVVFGPGSGRYGPGPR